MKDFKIYIFYTFAIEKQYQNSKKHDKTKRNHIHVRHICNG